MFTKIKSKKKNKNFEKLLDPESKFASNRLVATCDLVHLVDTKLLQ